MDEVRAFCRRMLGAGAAAETVADRAEQASEQRIGRIAEAVRLCRGAHETSTPERAGGQDAGADASPLVTAVAGELSAASSRLRESDRELLALRELLRLSHAEIAQALALAPATVAPLLAEARLQLRISRRGSIEPDAPRGCAERGRALAVLARRQDHEPLTDEDHDWLFAHLGGCPDCEAAHAAMLEASACYRAWPIELAGSTGPIADAAA